jgi:hypothetical protein
MISTRWGSLSVTAASSTASADGSTSSRSTNRPSVFETAFCVTTSTSPSASASLRRERGEHQPGQVGAGLDEREPGQCDQLDALGHRALPVYAAGGTR